MRTTNAKFDEYTFPQITSPRIQDLQKEVISTKESRNESRKQKAKAPKDRVRGTGTEQPTEQPVVDARVLQDLDQSGPLEVTDQSGPLGATDTTGLLEAGETATPDNTIVVELPEVAVGGHSAD